MAINLPKIIERFQFALFALFDLRAANEIIGCFFEGCDGNKIIAVFDSIEHVFKACS